MVALKEIHSRAEQYAHWFNDHFLSLIASVRNLGHNAFWRICFWAGLWEQFAWLNQIQVCDLLLSSRTAGRRGVNLLHRVPRDARQRSRSSVQRRRRSHGRARCDAHLSARALDGWRPRSSAPCFSAACVCGASSNACSGVLSTTCTLLTLLLAWGVPCAGRRGCER